IVGFTLAAAVLLVFDQLKNLVGLHDRGAATDHFLVRFWRTLFEGGPVNEWAAAIGLGTIAFVLGLRWLNGRLGLHLPDLLLAVVLMAFVVWLGGLDQHGKLGPDGINGEIPRALPAFALPPFDWVRIRDLAPRPLALPLPGLPQAFSLSQAT